MILTEPLEVFAADSVSKCLSCHLTDNGKLNITGVKEIEGLPDTWSLLFFDPFDLNDDGISGQISIVNGGGTPLIAKWGSNLAAFKFEDFADIASEVHDININSQLEMDNIRKLFKSLSPEPIHQVLEPSTSKIFVEHGCSSCHVLESYILEEKIVFPYSDFLLHDVGYGLKRTAPLWDKKMIFNQEFISNFVHREKR